MAIAVRAQLVKTITSGIRNVTVSVPAGAVVGDPLLFVVAVHGNNDGSDYTLAGHDDWTAVDEETALLAGQGRRRLYAWIRTYATGDTSWTFPGVGTPPNRVAAIFAFSGVNAATPVEQTDTLKSDTNTTSHTAPGLTTSADNAWLLCLWTSLLGGDNTPPAGMTQLVSTRKAATSGGFGNCDLGVAYKLIATAGATGAQTITAGTTLTYAAISIELTDSIVDRTVTVQEGLEVKLRVGVPEVEHEPTATAGEELLTKEGADLRLLTTFEPADRGTGSTTTVRFATGPYRTDASDSVPNAIYRSRLEQAVSIKRSIFKDRLIGGAGIPAQGEYRILNTDGAFDALRELDWSDRAVSTVVAGFNRYGTRVPTDDAYPMFTGRTASLEADLRRLTIRTADVAKRFENPAQELVFAGTGGLEGGEELTGKRKPLCAGAIPSCKPVKVSAVEDKYVFHASAAGDNCRSLDAVRVGANLLSTDDYDVTLTGGVNWFQINTSIQGEVTCAVTGPSGAGDASAELARYIASTVGPLAAAELDLTSLGIFQASLPGPAYLYLDDDRSLGEVLTFLSGPGGYWTVDEVGRLSMGLIRDPQGASVDHQIRESQVLDIQVLAAEAVPWRLRLGYRINYHQLTEDQVVEAARSTEAGAYAMQPYLIAAHEDVAKLTFDATAPDPEVWPCALAELEDAQEEIDRLWDIHRRPWDIFVVRLDRSGWRIRLNQVVELTHSRFGLDAGERFLVIETEWDDTGSTLTLFRPVESALLSMESGETFELEDGSLLEI